MPMPRWQHRASTPGRTAASSRLDGSKPSQLSTAGSMVPNLRQLALLGANEADTNQIAVEPGITIAAPRTTSRDIKRHKASNCKPG